jgi:hypothetical protein
MLVGVDTARLTALRGNSTAADTDHLSPMFSSECPSLLKAICVHSNDIYISMLVPHHTLLCSDVFIQKLVSLVVQV